MKHTIEVNQEGIAYVNIVGDGDAQVARDFVDKAEHELSKYKGDTVDAIVDMSESGDSDYEGIRIYQGFFKTPKLGKIAFVNCSEALKVLVTLAVKLKKHDVNFFNNAQDALTWIELERTKR